MINVDFVVPKSEGSGIQESTPPHSPPFHHSANVSCGLVTAYCQLLFDTLLFLNDSQQLPHTLQILSRSICRAGFSISILFYLSSDFYTHN